MGPGQRIAKQEHHCNRHNGSERIRIIPTTSRVVCPNVASLRIAQTPGAAVAGSQYDCFRIGLKHSKLLCQEEVAYHGTVSRPTDLLSRKTVANGFVPVNGNRRPSCMPYCTYSTWLLSTG